VGVSYRRKSDRAWTEGLPLLRIGNERINENALQCITPNGFAGSLFDVMAADHNYFEGHHPQHRPGVPGRAQAHHRIERPDDPPLPLRERRPRRLHRLVGIEGLGRPVPHDGPRP